MLLQKKFKIYKNPGVDEKNSKKNAKLFAKNNFQKSPKAGKKFQDLGHLDSYNHAFDKKFNHISAS